MEDMEGTQDKQLTQRQLDALPYLIAPGPLSQKAMNAGISRKTLYRWLQEDDFRRRLQATTEHAMRLADTQLQLVAHQAVAVLYESLHDSSPEIKLRAAQAIIKLGQASEHGLRLERQLEAIEDSIAIREDMSFPY